MGIKEMLAASQGAPSFFNADSRVGDSITGQITATAVRQATDFMTKAPLTWDDGNPREQIVITLATNLRDEGPDDDGARSIYVKWWGSQRQALVAAIKESGDDDIRVGGTFSATYVRDEPATERGLSATKIYSYRYQKPSATSGLFTQAEPAPTQVDPWQASSPADDPWGAQRNGNGNGHAAPAAAPLPPAAAPPAPAAPAAPAAIAPEDAQAKMAQVRALIGMGLPDQQIAAALGVDHNAVAAIRSIPSV